MDAIEIICYTSICVYAYLLTYVRHIYIYRCTYVCIRKRYVFSGRSLFEWDLVRVSSFDVHVLKVSIVQHV